MKHFAHAPFFLLLFLFAFGCSPSRDADAGAVRLRMLEDGTAQWNGEAVSLEALPARIAAVAEAGDTVWYHREGTRTDPHPHALEVLRMLVDANVPVRLFRDPEFSGPDR